MKPITQLTKNDIKNLKIVCFDVDGVTIKKGTDIKQTRTKDKTKLVRVTNNLTDRMKNKLIALKKYYVVAINSGRDSMYLTDIFVDLLWGNTALISEIGIFTLMKGKLTQHEEFDERTLEIMRKIKVDLAKLEGRDPDFGSFEPKQFLITLHAKSEIPEVYDIVKKHDKKNEFYAIWNGEAFDIAPERLNKGTALKNFAEYLNVPIKNTMAIANGPNDKHMVDMAGIGVTTEPEELKADFFTTDDQHLGGEQLVDVLLKLNK